MKYELPSGKACIEGIESIGSINYAPTYVTPMGRKSTDDALREALMELGKIELERHKDLMRNG